jgi:cyclin A
LHTPATTPHHQQEATPHPSGYLHTTQAATGVTAVHRATVVDNMVSAAARLALTNDSLFTAVAVLDRYLALKPTPLPLLQPTAIACLWVAAKYEQLVVPPVAQFALLVQGTDAGLSGGGSSALGRQLLVELEADVLAVLEFCLAAIVTVKSFKAALMSRLQGSKAAAGLCRRQLDQLYCMASYLTEVSMLEYRLLCCPPSQVAAAAFVYALMLLGLPYADAVRLTGYTQEGLQALLEMFCALHTTLSAALQLRRPYNVTVKYCSPAVRGVAHIPPELRMEQRAW